MVFLAFSHSFCIACRRSLSQLVGWRLDEISEYYSRNRFVASWLRTPFRHRTSTAKSKSPDRRAFLRKRPGLAFPLGLGFPTHGTSYRPPALELKPTP